VVANVDAYLDGPVDALLSGWDGDRVRLLVVDDTTRGDFGRWRFAGCSLLPWREISPMRPVFSGLYETCWQPAIDAARVELVPFTGSFVDCGTPADYLRANLHASGGDSVIGDGAVIRGEIERCVVWPGAEVRAGERLIESIRAAGLTVDAHQTRQARGPAAPGST